MSVKNKLEFLDQPEDLKLTDFEGMLIARNLMFQKIYKLPKSRWTTLSDKVINVPINNEDIISTVALLPRTPKDAQLIGISLKRRLEYKNPYKVQLINPNKVKNVLEMLKKSRNPYYQCNIEE